MDPRIIIATLGIVVVLLLARGLRYFAGKFAKGRPTWAVIASSVALALCVFAVMSHFNVGGIVDCLQGNTLAACTSTNTFPKVVQPQ